MTREDVVNSYGYKVAKASVDYSQKYAKDDELQGIVMDTFEDAAKFGYNLAIDKAVDWLEKKACLYVWKNCEQGEHGIHKTMLEDLRKAMKGE